MFSGKTWKITFNITTSDNNESDIGLSTGDINIEYIWKKDESDYKI